MVLLEESVLATKSAFAVGAVTDDGGDFDLAALKAAAGLLGWDAAAEWESHGEGGVVW